MKSASLPLLAAILGACVLVTGCPRPNGGTPRKDFTEQEVTEIKALLANANPSSYRLVLPVYRNQTIAGTETVGGLPFTEVQRLASLKGVQVQETANLQAVLEGNDSGGGGSGGEKNQGPGSHINTSSGGVELINRIELVMRNIEVNRYVFIH